MLYHKDIFIPDSLKQKVYKDFALEFGRHAKEACINDRYEVIYPPKSITVNNDNLLEIETNGINPTKVVIRQPHTEAFDLTMVFIPEVNRAFVKTLWLNNKNDRHETLNPTPYARN